MDLITKVLQEKDLEQAAQLLEQGQVVAFPTETVYGLGANALDPQAVAAIFKIKGRPEDNPLIVHLYSRAQLRDLVRSIPPAALPLMDAFWPGPLTLVFEKTARIPAIVSAGLPTVAIRIPDHPLALQLLERVQFPLAAPSANLSGRPSPTRAEHVVLDLQGRVPAVLDGGKTGRGLESTVLDCTAEPFRLLRPGGVTLEELRRLTPIRFEEEQKWDGEQAPLSPGLKYEHYAPRACVYLVLGAKSQAKIEEMSGPFLQAGKQVGIMTWDERAELFPRLLALKMGPQGDLPSLAANLYHLLREADRFGLHVLFIEGVDERHLGLAIMNRLRKAARNQVIET